MANTRVRFCSFPSVVPAGKRSTVTIFPCDISRRFREELSYEVGIIGLCDDMLSYIDKLPLDLPWYVKDGTLQVEYEFSREQEYEISFGVKGEKPQVVSVYALEEDLYSCRPLKGDLHTHSYYSDGSDGVAMVAANYREQGFDFFALTDHNRMYPSRFAAKIWEGVKLGIHIMTGEEVHTPGSLVHIVNVGAKESVCEKYVRDPEGYERAVDEIEKELSHIPEAYRRRVAMAHWACRKIQAADGIAILAHPYWKPYRYNLSDALCDLLFGEKLFHAFELMGGISSRLCNLQLALWQNQKAKGRELPVVGSSDSHEHNFDEKCFGHRFTIVFSKENSTEAILEAIRRGYCVAAELPLGEDKDVRFYGDLRLVSFSHFLFRNYFDKTLELGKIEGALMQRYAAGEEVGALLTALSPSVEHFYQQFYGHAPAPVLSAPRKAFLDSLLDAQCSSGIVTKGSNLELRPGKARRE